MRSGVVLLAVSAALAAAAPAQAAVYTVTDGSSDSTATCSGATCPSLRAALAAAALTRPADTINVPAGTIRINNDLVADSDVTIVGNSARTNIIDGGAKYRGLQVPTGNTVTLSHFTIQNGAANQAGSSDGGAVLNVGSTLTLDHVHLTTSRAARGGGLATTYTGSTGAQTTVTHSLIDGNTATTTGGGVANIGYVETSPFTVAGLSDTTVFGNTATAATGTGGIATIGNGSLLTLLRATIADNLGGTDGGIGGLSVAVAGRAQVAGSILARNKAGAAIVNCGAVKPTDGGNDVEDETDCGFAAGGGLDPKLATKLSSEGGEVDVLAIASGSPAVDRLPVATNCPAATLDQRDLYRPQGSACDSGAYELDQAATMTITGGPSGTVNSGDVQFDFSSSEPSVNPVCQLTGPGQSSGYVACYKSNAQPYSGLANGNYTFSVRDGAFPASAPSTRAFTVAALDTTITGGPTGPTNNPTPTFTFTGVNGAASFQCRVDTAAFAACTTPFTTATLPAGAHTFEVRALSAAGAPDPTPASRAFTVDTTAPDTTITSGPSGTVASASAAFTYTSSESGSTFQCQLDGGGFGACPASYTGLGQGSHTFQVRATDPAGNTDGTPASQTWTVDTAPPDTTITSGPAGTVGSASATFTYTSNETGATFQCQLDGGGFGACPASYTGLGQGAHTFQVRATDAAGNVDATPDSRTWTVDTVAPNTTLTPVASPSNDTTPTFSFTSSEAGSTFQCRLDGAAFASCTSPLTTAALADGSHTFEVRAIDGAGNVDATPASQTFLIDTTTPNTDIVTGPGAATNDTTPTFTFTGSAGATSFQCRVDGATFTACSSPFTTAALAVGTHTVDIRALNSAGTPDASPASRTFVVDLTAPNTTLTPIATPTRDTTPTFAFTSTEAGSTFECRIDAAAYAACASPLTTAPLADGEHTFAVRATDAAGNTDVTPATQTFTLDTGAPSTTISGGPAGLTNDATPTFTFASDEAGSTFECRIDGAPFTSCASPLETTALADGAHTFEVRATDTTGNVDPTPASRSFTVDTAPPAAPDVVSGPAGPTSNSSPEFTFAAADAASTACRLDGPGGATGDFAPCTSPKAFNSLAPGDYVFFVRSVDAAGNAQTSQRAFTVTVPQQATPTPTPTATPTPTPGPPPPVANQSVDIKPVSGTVLIKLPGSKVFVKLSPSLIKNGAEVDARKGVVEITRSDGGVARFYDGIFKLSHSGGYTVLTLTEKLTGCPKAKQSLAGAAAKKPKTRKLWGDGKGKFRTKGQYSAATVRGTKWLVTDTCTTTVTKVATGVVEVQDLVKKQKLLVRAPKSYTARAKKK